jgi:3-hydroxybutyryl-CoA dehydrogenase
VIYDLSDQAVQRTQRQIRDAQSWEADQSLEGKADLESALSRLQPASSLDAFAGCDVVIEAIAEDMDAKKQLLAQLDKTCPPGTVLASNTSALSITEMSMATQRRDRVGGLHFHLPVTRIPLVDVIPGLFTSEETIQTLEELGKSLGKKVVLAKDTPGFIVNRLLMPYLLDAIRMLELGVADRDAIDTSMRLAANHPMGPLLLADYIGLDTLYSVARTLYKEIGGERLRPPLLLERMVQAGCYGVKSGRGFYSYTQPMDEGDRRAQLTIQMAQIFGR